MEKIGKKEKALIVEQKGETFNKLWFYARWNSSVCIWY